MRIGIDARFWHSTNTGIGQYTKGLVHALAKLDHQNDYTVFIRRKDLEEWDIAAGNFRPVVIDIPHYSLREQLVLPFILLSHRLDLVHFANFNHPILYPGRFTVTIHDLAYFVFPGRRLKSGLFKWSYYLTMWMATRRAAKIIAVTKYTRDQVIRILRCNPAKIRVILEGVDRSRFPATRRNLAALRRRLGLKWPVIFYVGNSRPHKNLTTLLTAFEKLRREGVKAQLLLGGKMEAEVAGLIRQHAFHKDIIAAGFIPNAELADYYGLAAVFVYPSLYEGFGLQILEAQFMGVPVAASNSTTLPEVGGKAAIYFDPLDADKMALVVSKILQDNQLQAELIAKGKKNLSRFSWEKTAQETLKLFEEMKYGRVK